MEYTMKKILLTALLISPFIVLSRGQSTTKQFTNSALKAMGAPNNPKVEIAWNRYYNTDEIYDICQRLTKAYPDLVRYASIGKSVQGKDIHLLTVTNFNAGIADRKPGMYIDGNIHSNEIQGAEVALYTAWFLVENFVQIEWIKDLLDNKIFYIIPTINPDARDYFIAEANNPHSPRTGMLPRDDDLDGLIDEDGPDDLDGDGNIVLMRKRDRNGRWRQDPDDERLMIPVKPDEPGEFTLIDWEGIDNDGDGQVNEDGPGFYDPNRNWAWNWQPVYIQWGADQYPFSIPENRAVANFVLAHSNICGAQSYHNAGGMILRGPGNADDQDTYHGEDLAMYDFLGKLGEEMLPGYHYYVVFKDLYNLYGGELDWFYGARGIFSFSNELWSSFDYFRRENDRDSDWFGSQKTQSRFDRLLLFGEGFVPWKPYHHPQYGEIELGGEKKSWTRTAPSFMLEEMCHRNMAFTLFHAYHLPQLAVDSVNVKTLPGNLRQIDVIIKNERVLSTRSHHEIECKISPPDYITLGGKKIKIISGFIVADPYLGLMREQKYQPHKIGLDLIEGMGTVYLRWIVEGEPPYQIEIDSKKGGLIHYTIAGI
jgi:hypothetical protein